MKQFLIIFAGVVLFVIVAVTACTKNEMAKNYGGAVTYDLKPGQKFVNATWKDDNLWIITEARTDSVPPRTYVMTEKSSYGVWCGTVTIVEK